MIDKVKWIMLRTLSLHNVYVRKILHWDPDRMRRGMSFGLNPNQKDFWGVEPLLSAAVKERNVEAVILLLNHGADPNLRDDLGQTPVFYAIENGDVDSVRELASSGADVEAENNIGMPPLGWCIVEFVGNKRDGKSDMWARNLQCAQILLSHGADPNSHSKRLDDTPFTMSACKGGEEMFKLFLDHGADPFSKNKSGVSPVEIVRQKGLVDIERLIVS